MKSKKKKEHREMSQAERDAFERDFRAAVDTTLAAAGSNMPPSSTPASTDIPGISSGSIPLKPKPRLKEKLSKSRLSTYWGPHDLEPEDSSIPSGPGTSVEGVPSEAAVCVKQSNYHISDHVISSKTMQSPLSAVAEKQGKDSYPEGVAPSENVLSEEVSEKGLLRAFQSNAHTTRYCRIGADLYFSGIKSGGQVQ